MQKVSGQMTVYGFSTEGYRWASVASSRGLPTIIADERLQICMEINPNLVAAYPTLESLAKDEVPLGIKPFQDAIRKARYVVFAPRIRASRVEARREVLTRLTDMARNLSKDIIVISLVPSGPGDNAENIRVLTKISGLSEVPYVYLPTQAGEETPAFAGLSDFKSSSVISDLFKFLGWKTPPLLPISSAEILHIRKILSQYQDFLMDLELSKLYRVEGRATLKGVSGINEVYLDTLAANLFDVYMADLTMRSSEILRHGTAGIVKGMEDYSRFLVESVIDYMKREGIKAAKTRVVVAWLTDQYEIRVGRIRMLGRLLERLSEHLRDVVSYPPQYGEPYPGGSSPLLPDKTNIVISCSKQDFEYWSKSSEERVLLKSTLPLLF